jgi:hypothetical protein
MNGSDFYRYLVKHGVEFIELRNVEDLLDTDVYIDKNTIIFYNDMFEIVAANSSNSKNFRESLDDFLAKVGVRPIYATSSDELTQEILKELGFISYVPTKFVLVK